MKKALTQERLAEMLDITPIHLKNIEGSRRIPSVPLLFRMMELLDFSVDALVFPERERAPAIHTDGLTEREAEALERLVDAMSAKMLDPEFNKGIEVVVLPNLYGDIVTDVAAEHQGGLGTASSSNLGNKYAMFEAIHGTAPFLINHGRGDYADPCSLIRAAGMLMAHIGYADRKAVLDKALDICTITERKKVVTTDVDGASAAEFTDYLLETIDKIK